MATKKENIDRAKEHIVEAIRYLSYAGQWTGIEYLAKAARVSYSTEGDCEDKEG